MAVTKVGNSKDMQTASWQRHVSWTVAENIYAKYQAYGRLELADSSLTAAISRVIKGSV
jgi:hypothetical protein